MKIPIKWFFPVLLVSLIGGATASITWPGAVRFTGSNLPSIVGPGSSFSLNCMAGYYHITFTGQYPVPRVSRVYGSPGAAGGVGWPTDVGVIFDCGLDSTTGLRVPALDVLLGGTFMATFTDGGQNPSPPVPLTAPLSAPYTDVGLVSENLYGRTCHASDLVADLGADTSAAPATVSLQDGSYNYCIFFDVSTVGGSTGLANAFQQFGIRWTQ